MVSRFGSVATDVAGRCQARRARRTNHSTALATRIFDLSTGHCLGGGWGRRGGGLVSSFVEQYSH